MKTPKQPNTHKALRNMLCGLLAATMAAGLSGCTNGEFNPSSRINVVTREDGSGTKSAFIELFGIELKDGEGHKTDRTTDEADVATQTSAMLETVAGDDYAIGYVSMGSINEKIKVLSIDGTAATLENVLNGTYKIARPFNIATKGEPQGAVKDFIGFIMSAEGQQIAGNGYTPIVTDAPAYVNTSPEGKIVVAGSTSVTPLMEKLIEAYKAIHPGMEVELQTNDSTTGLSSVNEGIADVGMASRDLSAEELQTLVPVAIAMDGIAVIVNQNNPTDNLQSEQVRDIYIGDITGWDMTK
jgi:phosphate transport system substrate-binding protein